MQDTIDMNVDILRTMVRTVYDMQKLRIQMGNRITASFKVKLGQSVEGGSEAELEAEQTKLLTDLRQSHSRITDGVVSGGTLTERRFVADGLITQFSEMLLMSNYVNTLKNEERHFKDMEYILEKIPVYTEYLKGVRGVGPAMAAILISEIDIFRTPTVSSLWGLAGLDVVICFVYKEKENGPDLHVPSQYVAEYYSDHNNLDVPMVYNGYPVEMKGIGRNKQKYSLVQRTYIDREGNEQTKMSIKFNPFLKTKLIGVLGGSFLKSGYIGVNGKRMGGVKRLELAVSEGYVVKKGVDAAAQDAEVMDYLRMRGHNVVIEESKFARIYYDYRNRLDRMPVHDSKSKKHKHNMAIRYMVKMFLQELYNEWRAIEELPVNPSWAEAKLHVTHGVPSSNRADMDRNRIRLYLQYLQESGNTVEKESDHD